jgi:hypothetical protein
MSASILARSTSPWNLYLISLKVWMLASSKQEKCSNGFKESLIEAYNIFMKSIGFGAKTALLAAFFQTITFRGEEWGAGIYFQVIYCGFFASALSIFSCIMLQLRSQVRIRQSASWEEFRRRWILMRR